MNFDAYENAPNEVAVEVQVNKQRAHSKQPVSSMPAHYSVSMPA